MSTLKDTEKDVVRDALVLLKGHITKRHFKSVSRLPRNGKAPSDAASEGAETSLIKRLKDIDIVLHQCNTAANSNGKPSVADSGRASSKVKASAASDDIEEEPYINPFTGQMVFPPSINAPGPSSYKPNLSPADIPQLDHSRQDYDDQEYRKSLDVQAVFASSELAHEDSLSSSSTEEGPLTPLYDDRDVSIPSNVITPCTTVPSMRSDDLQTFLKEFDDEYIQKNGSMPQPLLQHTLADQNTSSSGLQPSLRSTNVFHIGSRSSKHLTDLDKHETGPVHVDFWQDEPILDRHPDGKEAETPVAAAPGDYSDTNITQDRMDLAALQMATELVDDTPQNLYDFYDVHDALTTQQQEELQAIQDEIYRQDQEEMDLTMAKMQAMQDEWNREWEGSVEQQQALAQQIAEQEDQKELAMRLTEMRMLQDMFQTEENRQIEADRRLAWSLSEEASEGQPPPPNPAVNSFPVSSEPPPKYTESDRNNDGTNPFRNVGQAAHTPPATDRSSKKVVARYLDDSFERAERIHDQWQTQWQTEIDNNAKAAQAAQKQIENFKAQARRDLEFLQQQDLQRREEEERQRKEEERRRQEAERLKRQEEERQRLEEEQRRQEAERRREAEEAARKARLVDCAVCSDEYDMDLVVRFPCNHAYCQECLTQSIQNAVRSKTAFHCCNHRADLAAILVLLSASLVGQYTNVVQELDTPNPVYCSTSRCSAFIPPGDIKGGTATCPKCRRQTCANCKRATHAGICAEDTDGQALLALSQSKLWKMCPHCGNMVERKSGCLHMTCRCGRTFCYSCGKRSTECSGTCTRNW